MAFIDADSHLGRAYQARKQTESPFYANAAFVTADQVVVGLEETGFSVLRTARTLFPDASSTLNLVSTEESDEGAFVVISSKKLG